MDPSVILPPNGHIEVGPSSASLSAQATRLDAVAISLGLSTGGHYAANEVSAGVPTLAAIVARYNTLQALIADVGSQLDGSATLATLSAAIGTIATVGRKAA